MSNHLLPVPEFLAQDILAQEILAEDIPAPKPNAALHGHAAVDAITDAVVGAPANGYGSLVLADLPIVADFVRPDRRPDFAAEAEVRDPRAPTASDDADAQNHRLAEGIAEGLAKGLFEGLADLAVTVAQIETVLQANGPLSPDTHFAVERIHDVAMALRMREVDAVLCDALEASTREIGDALVRSDAAAARSLSAAALLRDIARRI